MVTPPSPLQSLPLSVVIPVKDERGNIAPLAAEIIAALDPEAQFEVIFVDDGSSDDTSSEIHHAIERHPGRVRGVKLAHNCGQSTAVHQGVNAARYPWVATLDGDGQNPPAEINTLMAALQRNGSDPLLLVAGCRRQRNDNWVRHLSSRIANGVRRRILHDDTPDTGCGLKLFARDTFLQLPYFDHMHRFLPALYKRLGGRVCCVDVNHRPRAEGRSKYGIHNRLWVGIVDLFGVAWLQRRAKLSAASEIK